MDTDKFYKQTTIPAPVVDYKTVWNIDSRDPRDTNPRWLTYPKDSKIWDDTTLNKLLSVGLTPRLIRVFRWKPKSVFPWHVDGSVAEITEFAINWVYEGSGIIQWNSSLELPKPDKKNYHLAYGSFDGNKDDKFEVESLGHGCIVNTTVPHRVLNLSEIHRITVSIQFGNEFTYSEAVERLKSCGFIE
jgi:hypothetical protein